MSGKNHAYGHYHQYDRVLDDGDFVILDAAPDYENYHVDISTTFSRVREVLAAAEGTVRGGPRRARRVHPALPPG